MIDPITLEVLREAFVSIVREMRVTLVRTAYSSILYEWEDFSCVLMDGRAQIVAMSKGHDHPLHIVPIAWSMRAVREKFGDDIQPGDVFLHNEPYTGGTHLNDVAMIAPLFAPGTSGAGASSSGSETNTPVGVTTLAPKSTAGCPSAARSDALACRPRREPAPATFGQTVPPATSTGKARKADRSPDGDPDPL